MWVGISLYKFKFTTYLSFMQAGMKKTIAFLTPQKLLMASKIIFEITETKKTKKNNLL